MIKQVQRYAIRVRIIQGELTGEYFWHTQGLVQLDEYDPFSFAILFASMEHAKKAAKKNYQRKWANDEARWEVEFVPVTVTANLPEGV